MSRRRMVIAFEQVQGPQSRMLDELLTGRMTPLSERRNPPGYGHYWCAADAPEQDDQDFRLRAVYRTHDVPEDARCEVCGIGIRELQTMMTRTLDG